MVVAERQLVPGVAWQTPAPVKTLQGPEHRPAVTVLQKVMVVVSGFRPMSSRGAPVKVRLSLVVASQFFISATLTTPLALLEVASVS